MQHYAEIEKLILENYSLTTAEIVYHLPDTPHVLQSYIWQDYDIAPQFPVLHKFLHFWVHELEGPLHSIVLADRKIITASDFYHYSGEYIVN